MQSTASTRRGHRLLAQLRWLVRLRWWVGAAIVLAAVANWQWLQWYAMPNWIMSVGLVVLFYNAVLWAMLRRISISVAWNAVLVYVQIGLDLMCLTVLVALTHGLASPLLGLYVLHMVFASLLLSRPIAYAVAGISIVLLMVGLGASGQWPADQLGTLRLFGWALTLVLTVYLANHITNSLQRHRRRLIIRNRRIRQLLRRLQRQQIAMIQHEKAVTMGRMAAGLAHEIANPLASMEALLQLMLRRPQTVTAEKMEQLRQQVERIRCTLRQMTDFAHLTDYQWDTVSMKALVESGLQMVRFDHRLRKIKLKIELPENPCMVCVQPHAVQQALTNLLMNAIDALNDVAEPVLIVRCRRVGDACVVEVIDNGPGIAADHRADIFEPFFTTKPVGKGTGLGLAISRMLMRNQGGSVELDTAVDNGAAFRLILPSGASAARPPASGNEAVVRPVL